MTLTLTANISSSADELQITGTVPAEIDRGYLFTLGSSTEILRIRGFALRAWPDLNENPGRNTWLVARAQQGTDAAGHTAGDAVKGVVDAFVAGSSEAEPSPFPSGGPGSTPDLDAVLAASPEQDIADALSGAASPSVSNVFATMADVGGAITSPLQIAGCVLWLDASDETTINAGSPSDDDPVSAWADKSTSGFDAVQATGDNQPVYKTAVQNGLSTLRFDSTVTPRFLGLSGAGLGLARDLSAVTVACVAILERAGGSNILSIGDDSTTTPVLSADSRADDWVLQVFNDGSNSIGPSFNRTRTDVGLPQFVAYVGVAAVDLLTGSAGIETNMPESFGGVANSLTALDPTPDVDSEVARIGGPYDNDAAGYQGDICEVIVYRRALTARERRVLFEYLSEKWATQ